MLYPPDALKAPKGELMLNIRSYQEKDAAAVSHLWQECFPDAPPHNRPLEDIQRKLAVQRELFLVALLDEQLVGTVMAGYDGHRGWVYYVAVSSRRQRRGIGAALMKQAELKLAALGCTKINLQVRTSNTAVVAFYRSLGYLVEERVSMGKLL